VAAPFHFDEDLDAGPLAPDALHDRIVAEIADYRRPRPPPPAAAKAAVPPPPPAKAAAPPVKSAKRRASSGDSSGDSGGGSAAASPTTRPRKMAKEDGRCENQGVGCMRPLTRNNSSESAAWVAGVTLACPAEGATIDAAGLAHDLEHGVDG
jgi:hypothetical protein